MPVVRLGGLTFNDGPDVDGDEFVVDEIEGWDSPGVDVTLVERPVSDGAVVARARRSSRALSVSGYVIAADTTTVARARNKLASACDGIITADGTLEVDEGGGTYTLTVRMVQALRTRTVAPQVIKFDVSLTAPTPTKTFT